MLFYLSALAVAGALASVGLSVVLALLTFTSDERCRRIEDGVKARIMGRFSRQATAQPPAPERPHPPSNGV